LKLGGLQQTAPADLVVPIIEESLQKDHKKITLKGGFLVPFFVIVKK